MTLKSNRANILLISVAVTIFLFWFLLAKDNYFHWDEWEYFLNFKDLPYYLLHQSHEQFAFVQILHHFILFKIVGLTYLPFQFSESFFHAINSLLLFKVVFNETQNRKLALLSMILFGFSSVSAENLNNSAAISQVFAGFFLFSAFLCFQTFLKTKRASYVLLSLPLLALSPMGHGFTLLYPFAFCFLAFVSKTARRKLAAISFFLTGLFVLILTATFGKNLGTNIHFSIKYFLIDIPNFVIAGVIRGNIVRLFFPELHLFTSQQMTLPYDLRNTIRTTLRLLPIFSIVISVLLIPYLFRLKQLQRHKNEFISFLVKFVPLIIVGYLAAAPTRASFGFNQAIITRYTYEPFFFLLVLGACLLNLIPPKKLWLNSLFTLVIIYSFSIHLFASINFQKNHWAQVAKHDKSFIADVRYLFATNSTVYDFPARGIWPTITLSKLWFLLPPGKEIKFLPADFYQKNFPAASDERSRLIYTKLQTLYQQKAD